MVKKQYTLTDKQKKYIKNRRAGLNKYQSAINAGYSKNTAINAKKDLDQPLKKRGLQSVLEELGVTDKYLIRKAKQGLNAKKIVTSHTEPDYKFPDYNIRHKYLETALRLRGYGKDYGIKINIDQRKAYVRLPERKQEINSNKQKASKGT